MPSPVPRILVADHAEGFAVFRDALASGHACTHVHTFEEAKAALLEPTALVVCGCHFDEGRIYDLLRYLKAVPGCANVPFLATRCLRGELLLDHALYESMKIAVRALGGNAFVDYVRWQQRLGRQGASQRLTHLVETLISAAPGDTAFG